MIPNFVPQGGYFLDNGFIEALRDSPEIIGPLNPDGRLDPCEPEAVPGKGVHVMTEDDGPTFRVLDKARNALKRKALTLQGVQQFSVCLNSKIACHEIPIGMR